MTKDELRVGVAEVRVEIANLAAELRKEMQAQTRWLTGVVLVAIAVVGSIARYA